MKRRNAKYRLGALTLAATMLGTSLAGGAVPVQAASKADKVITISPENASPFNEGKFEGWGTSFCWWANRIGYNETLSQKAAELFYSKDTGLGLNIIRYNIGGGDDPSHDHITRTDSEVPGYWKDGSETYSNGTYTWEYDWTKDANQRNVLQDCMEEYGEDIIVEAFSNSPPYFMTNSGCSSGATDASKDNLKSDAYDAFAKYMAEVSAHFRDEWDIEFQSITAMNEPYTNYWGAMSNKQEGCHFDQGDSQSNMITALKKAMDAEGFENIIYSGTDETSIDTQITSYNKLSAEAKEIVTRIDAHTYGGSKYSELKQTAINGNENLWMSEVDGGSTAGTEAGEMGAALWFADKIITDMNGLTPSAWIMWQVIDNHISEEGYNGNYDTGMPGTKGGYWGIAVADHDENEIILTKKYYAFGQFSRYIRPGYTIIGGTGNTLAALDKENDRLVIVATNTEGKDVTCDFDLSMFDTVGSKVEAVRTSGDLATGENWAELEPLTTYGTGFEATLKANSITTYIVEGVTSSGSIAFDEIALNADMVTGSAPWNNNQANGCANVVDGKLDTFFDGVGDGYVQIDLGESYSLQALAYAPRNGFAGRCVDASFYGSLDGETWYPLTTVKDTPGTTLNYVTSRAFDNNIVVNYVKYAVPSGNYNCNIAEIKLYGKTATEAEALESVVLILNDKLATYEAVKKGYYSDSSFAALTDAIAAAKAGEKTSLEAVQGYIAQLDAAYKALETTDAIPVEVTAQLSTVLVKAGETPELPATVATKTKGGEAAESAVVWKTDFDTTNTYATIMAEGVVEGTDLVVTQQLEVIPDADTLVYFIDCGTEAIGSEIYDMVKAKAINLVNTTSDQTYVSGTNTWGVGGAYNLKTDDSYDKTTEKKLTGYYSNNSSIEPLSYTLALKPGNYKITMQAHEWWSGPRTMKFEALINEGGNTRVVPLATEVSVSSSARDAQAAGVITLSEATEVTINLTPVGHEAAAISFLAVETTTDKEQGSTGEQDDTIASIYGAVPALATKVGAVPALPETIQVQTADSRITDAKITWNAYSENDFTEAYTRVAVEGAVVCPVTGTEFPVSTFVEIVPENLVYYIDCGMAESGSLAYNAVAALVKDLSNQVVDQTFDGSNTWGYTGIDGSYTGSGDSEKFATGHYGHNKSTTPVTYTLPLTTGTYDITMLVHNWWGSRTMSVEGVYTDAEGTEVQVPIQQNYAVDSHGGGNVFQTITKQVTVPNDTVLTLKFTADSGQDGAIINFIGVAQLKDVEDKDENAIVSVYESLPLYATTVGTQPVLPETVKALNAADKVVDAPITWDYKAADFNTAYSRVKVNGTVDGTELQTTASVEVVPADLLYFIDSGKAESGSDTYDVVKELIPNLLNEAADKTYNGTDGWGATGYQAAYTGSASEEKHLTGYYGENGSETPVEYVLPLSAGTYTITAMMHEWWSGPRTFDVTAVYTTKQGEQTVVIADNVVVSSEDRDKTVSGTITLDKEAVVRLQFKLAEGKEAPIVSFVAVNGEVSQREEKEFPFKDVEVDSWQYEGINYVYQNDVMAGVSEDEFSPNAPLKREQLPTILHNYEGCPEVTYTARFADVPEGVWYTFPVLWAAEKDITSGYGDVFGVGDDITREQLVTMLYSYAQILNKVDAAPEGDLSSFPDCGEVSDWAQEAMLWATQNGLVSGKYAEGGNIIDPKGTATRAECAAIMMEFDKQ